MDISAKHSSSAEPSYHRLATFWRVLLTAALLFHLTAVVVAPMALPPSSEFVQEIRQPFSDYLNLAYLDHGYRFFAPSPGPSHLVRYELELPDGETRKGVFPDLAHQWPRQIYHRHFMLSSKLFDYMTPPQLPADAPAEMRQRWQSVREVFKVVTRSYAQHLMYVTGADKVKLEFVQHNLPSPQDVLAGIKLSDPKLYQVLWTGTFERDQS
ncbi:MAG: hypothetical protein IT427_15325 [Pirellulales bacterium]|nr:hypothetical protein [Pirellulales bacterium]